MKSAVFFERDGVLNLVRVQNQHQVAPLTMEEFQPNLEALEPLQALKAAGFVLIATTNQPGLSRGYQSRRELDLMHTVLRHRFPLDDILICAHDESDRCPCRKPQAGLLQEAGFKWQLDLERSYVVSDKWQDARAAQTVGATSLLIRSPWNGNGHHDFVVNSIKDIAAKVVQLHSASCLAMHQV